MANAIEHQLEASRAELRSVEAEISELVRRRDILAAKVEAFEIAARYIGGLNAPQTALVKKTAERAPRTPKPSSTWETIFREMMTLYPSEFGYDEIMEVGAMLGEALKRDSLRTKMMNYVNDGLVERVGNGKFTFTQKGAVFFGLGTEMRKGPDYSEPLSNAGSVAERSNAPDSKSGGAEPSKLAPVGSNPTTSAPFNRVRDDLLTGVSFPSASSTPNSPLGRR